MSSTSAAPSSPTPLSAAESFCTERVLTTKNDKLYLQWQRTKLCLHPVTGAEDGSWQCPDHAKHIT